jgi:hypothetical protein
MSRCLRLHKVPDTAGFCAICGARVLPGWVWMCLVILPVSLIFGAVMSWLAARQYPAQMVTVEVTRIITATPPERTPTVREPTWTPSPTRTFTSTPSFTPTQTPTRSVTPTITSSPTTSATATATLFPLVAIKTFHGRYITAMGEEDDLVLRQEIEPDDPCSWFKLTSKSNGKITLWTCKEKYVTAQRIGTTQWDWRLGQDAEPSECAEFSVQMVGESEYAFLTCADHYFTAGDGYWPGSLQWLVITEATTINAWEIFTLEPP